MSWDVLIVNKCIIFNSYKSASNDLAIPNHLQSQYTVLSIRTQEYGGFFNKEFNPNNIEYLSSSLCEI